MEKFDTYLDLLRSDARRSSLPRRRSSDHGHQLFRDPQVFEALEKDVVPKLFEGRAPDENVRVWSVGCATGEEAYSLAMLLLEEAARRDASPTIQIFASDLHERSLAKAREGFYPGDIEADVSPERLRKYFHKENSGYRVRKEIRELVVFTPHNIMADPPFSRIDLVSCRNLMIYLQRNVQNQMIELFHYALRPDGFLILGTSEVLENSELFQLEDKKSCIYRKRNTASPEIRLPVVSGSADATVGKPGAQTRKRLNRSLTARFISSWSNNTLRPACSSVRTTRSCTFPSMPVVTACCRAGSLPPMR